MYAWPFFLAIVPNTGEWNVPLWPPVNSLVMISATKNAIIITIIICPASEMK